MICIACSGAPSPNAASSGGTRGGGGGQVGTTASAGVALSIGGSAGSIGRLGSGGELASGGVSTTGGAPLGGAAVASGGTATVGGTMSSGGKATGGMTATGSAGASVGCGGSSTLAYDQTVLCDRPVAFWAMTKTSGTEPDLSSRGNSGTYRGGTLTSTTLPNSDTAVVFNGSSQYLTIPSNSAYSIPTTGNFTWEAWIQPTLLQFPNDGGSGYVDWMGKCADYSPTCEWEARMYSTTNSEGRCNRISAYVFNPSAGLGSAADWQPACGLIQANRWYHVVGAYTTKSQPSSCANSASYPGSIDIWVNGVMWNQARHSPTGCMSQYSVGPKASNSPINIGTMAQDGWFPGAIAKVAFYDYLLTQTQVSNHYVVMTGNQPAGSCANDCSFQ